MAKKSQRDASRDALQSFVANFQAGEHKLRSMRSEAYRRVLPNYPSNLVAAAYSGDSEKIEAVEVQADRQWTQAMGVPALTSFDDLEIIMATVTAANFPPTEAGLHAWAMSKIQTLAAVPGEAEAGERTPADSKTDSAEKIPTSSRVQRAIKYVNNYYAKVAAGKAAMIPQTSILAEYFDRPVESKAVRNMARQLRNYRHLIRKPADS